MAPVSESGSSISIINSALGNAYLSKQLTDIQDAAFSGQSGPRAGINYLFFDRKMNLIPQISGIIPVGNSPGMFNNVGTPEIATTEPGYVIVYVDNRSVGTDVWFDNVSVSHYTGEILDQDHYYPYGLTVAESHDHMFTANPYKYQGIELNRNFGLETYETFYRGLDPQIGRWNGVDPKAEEYFEMSPYISMGNNPVTYTDPRGDQIPLIRPTPPLVAPIGQSSTETFHDAYYKGNPTITGEDIIFLDQRIFETIAGYISMPGHAPPPTVDQGRNDNLRMPQYPQATKSKVLTTDAIDQGVMKLVKSTETGGSNSTEKSEKSAQKLSPRVQKVVDLMKEYEKNGGQIDALKREKLKPNQELNILFKENGKTKLGFRIETHKVETKYGGNGVTPQRHMNVEWSPKPKRLPNAGHKILE